jgi:hypothetical protein
MPDAASIVRLQTSLPETIGERDARRARDKLAVVVAWFHELVVLGMLRYYPPGTFLSTFSAFYFRRTSNKQVKSQFDSIFLHVAAVLLNAQLTADLASALGTLQSFQVSRSSLYTLSSRDEAEEALQTVLCLEPLECKRKALASTFRLVIDKIFIFDDESDEMVFNADFVMPQPLRLKAAESIPARVSSSSKFIASSRCACC